MSQIKALRGRVLSRELAGACIWIVVGLYFLIFSYQIREPLTLNKFDPGPSLLPKIMGVLLICGGVYAATKTLATRDCKRDDRNSRGSRLLAATVFFYIFLLPVLGFHIATSIFGVFSMVIMSVGPGKSLICTLAIVALIHFVFVNLFAIPLPGFMGS